MSRPLIGLTTYREQARWGVWDSTADLLPAVYAKAVEAAGGAAVLLPPSTAPDDVAGHVVSRIDGLVISGGADVQPSRYGQQPHPRTGRSREDRDTWELALLAAADTMRLPVLGVCRGMQVMAVHAGGRLDQHTPELVGHDRHDPGGDAFGDVQVETSPGSRVAGLVGERLAVRCHHHQSVADHPGYVAVAWADDGVLEAMEVPGDRFCVAVQWHPEMAHDASLFRALVLAAGGS